LATCGQEPVLGLLHSQLQCWRCSSLRRFCYAEENISVFQKILPDFEVVVLNIFGNVGKIETRFLSMRSAASRSSATFFFRMSSCRMQNFQPSVFRISNKRQISEKSFVRTTNFSN
jgi:hypothetical protein